MRKARSKNENQAGTVLSEDDWKIKLENYCAYRERCEQEVRQKMYEWQIPEEDRDALLDYLKEHGFLNEHRFVTAFARGKFRIKHWGRNKIQAELRARQIKDPEIRQSMAQIDEGEYYISLLDLLEKKEKLLKEADAFKKKQKLYGYAIQKGYEPELIREALATLKI